MSFQVVLHQKPVFAAEREVDINGTRYKLGGDIITAIDNQSISKLDDILVYTEEHANVNDVYVKVILYLMQY